MSTPGAGSDGTVVPESATTVSPELVHDASTILATTSARLSPETTTTTAFQTNTVEKFTSSDIGCVIGIAVLACVAALLVWLLFLKRVCRGRREISPSNVRVDPAYSSPGKGLPNFAFSVPQTPQSETSIGELPLYDNFDPSTGGIMYEPRVTPPIGLPVGVPGSRVVAAPDLASLGSRSSSTSSSSPPPVDLLCGGSGEPGIVVCSGLGTTDSAGKQGGELVSTKTTHLFPYTLLPFRSLQNSHVGFVYA